MFMNISQSKFTAGYLTIRLKAIAQHIIGKDQMSSERFGWQQMPFSQLNS